MTPLGYPLGSRTGCVWAILVSLGGISKAGGWFVTEAWLNSVRGPLATLISLYPPPLPGGRSETSRALPNT